MFAFVFVKNKLTMIAGPLPFNSLDHLAETKVTMHFANDSWSAVHLDGREKLDKVVMFLLEKPGILDRRFF
jgi:hypothetical protein